MMDRPNLTLFIIQQKPVAPLLEADTFDLSLQHFNWNVKMRMVLILVAGPILTTS